MTLSDDSANHDTPDIAVTVVLAFVDEQRQHTCHVPAGSTARAILWQALAEGFSLDGLETPVHAIPLGRFGRLISDETVLQAGDRLELYRPLQQDPMSLRRQRERQGRSSG